MVTKVQRWLKRASLHPSKFRFQEHFRCTFASVSNCKLLINHVYLLLHRATFLQCESNNVNKVTTESLAKPVIIRASDGKKKNIDNFVLKNQNQFIHLLNCYDLGERPYVHQEIQTVQYGAFIGQVNMAHQPPTVSSKYYIYHFDYCNVFKCTEYKIKTLEKT